MQFARFLGLLEQNLGLHAESVSWNLHEASVGGVASAQHSRQSHKTVSPVTPTSIVLPGWTNGGVKPSTDVIDPGVTEYPEPIGLAATTLTRAFIRSIRPNRIANPPRITE